MVNEKNNTCYIALKCRHYVKKLFYEDIILIEKCYRNILFMTADDMIKIRGNSDDLKEYAGRCRDFYICHSYLAVNLKYVSSMEDGVISFVNGAERSLGRKNFTRARAVFSKYISV